MYFAFYVDDNVDVFLGIGTEEVEKSEKGSEMRSRRNSKEDFKNRSEIVYTSNNRGYLTQQESYSTFDPMSEGKFAVEPMQFKERLIN